MLGLILIYFIGKAFYDLAEEYEKHKWGFAIGGVASYYIGTFAGGIAIGLGSLVLDFNIEEMHNLVIGLMALPFGVLFCVIFYQILKRQWSRQPIVEGNNTLDEDLML